MFIITPTAKVFLSIETLDFRKQIPGLKKWIQVQMKEDAFSGAYFIFVSRNRKSMKIIHFDGQGMCLYLKKLSVGKYRKWNQIYDLAKGNMAISPTVGQVMLMNGNSDQIDIPKKWREI
jgi:transposase